MIRMITSYLAWAAFVVGAALGQAAEPPKIVSGLKEDLETLVAGNNEFAFAFHRRLAEKSDTNFFMSPISISSALAIVHAGARGETAAEMAEALSFKLPTERQARAFEHLLTELNGGEQKRPGELTIANALWVQESFPFRDSFLSLVGEHYQAKLCPLDFRMNAEGSRQEINKWVRVQTRDKIRELLQPNQVNPYTRLVVTNTVYLKKEWRDRFHKRLTREEWFSTPKEKKRVPMMHGGVYTDYYGDEEVQLLQLPYSDGQLAMFILLPNEKWEMAKFEQQLNWSKVNRWTQKLKYHSVTIYLPRVKVEARNHLSHLFSAMGMRLAFSEEADFSGMVSGGEIHVKEIVHQAYLSLDENGTEAAAATAICMPLLTTGVYRKPPPPVTFRADRPFLVFIRDRKTGAILFTGRIVDPSQ